MIENILLLCAILVFLLAAIGFGLTIYDFSYKLQGAKTPTLKKIKNKRKERKK